MKFIIYKSLFIWIMLIKNILLNTNIASNDDFIVNFSDRFSRHFENNEKLKIKNKREIH